MRTVWQAAWIFRCFFRNTMWATEDTFRPERTTTGDQLPNYGRRISCTVMEIKEYYNIFRPSYCLQCPTESVRKQVKSLLYLCQAFAGCVATITSARPTGTSDNAVLHLYTDPYNKKDVGSVHKPCGLPFRHLPRWEILKDHPKFIQIVHSIAIVV